MNSISIKCIKICVTYCYSTSANQSFWLCITLSLHFFVLYHTLFWWNCFVSFASWRYENYTSSTALYLSLYKKASANLIVFWKKVHQGQNCLVPRVAFQLAVHSGSQWSVYLTEKTQHAPLDSQPRTSKINPDWHLDIIIYFTVDTYWSHEIPIIWWTTVCVECFMIDRKSVV